MGTGKQGVDFELAGKTFVLSKDYLGENRRHSTEEEREDWRQRHEEVAVSADDGGKGPTLNIQANNVAVAIVIAAILAVGGYVWNSTQRIPTPDQVNEQRARFLDLANDVQKLKNDNAVLQFKVAALERQVTDVGADVKELLRRTPSESNGYPRPHDR